MNTVRILAKFPVMFSSVAVFASSVGIAAVLWALALPLPAALGPAALPAAALLFGLSVFAGWLLCIPFRTGGIAILLIGLVLALVLQWALFEGFGTFMLYTPGEIERNRTALPVLMSIEVAYAFAAAIVFIWLSRSAQGMAHAA